jgi:phosphonate transport system ATP-binding protein
MSEKQRAIAMIFQQHNLVKRLSVLKNVLVGRLAGYSSGLSLLQIFQREDVEIAMDCLRRLELDDKASMRRGFDQTMAHAELRKRACP